MKEITLTDFIYGIETGHIREMVVIKNKIYGKDSRQTSGTGKIYEVVWAEIL